MSEHIIRWISAFLVLISYFPHAACCLHYLPSISVFWTARYIMYFAILRHILPVYICDAVGRLQNERMNETNEHLPEGGIRNCGGGTMKRSGPGRDNNVRERLAGSRRGMKRRRRSHICRRGNANSGSDQWRLFQLKNVGLENTARSLASSPARRTQFVGR